MYKKFPCYYPGDFNPPTKYHLNTVEWLLNKPEIGHVYVVLGNHDENQLVQEKKAKLWEMLIKSSFSPNVSIVKSEKYHQIKEVINQIGKKKETPFYIALDEPLAKNLDLQKHFNQFPNYAMEIIPSQFNNSSKQFIKALKKKDESTIKSLLPETFNDQAVKDYVEILLNKDDPEAPQERSPFVDYKQRYINKFNDGFWSNVFYPLINEGDLNESISDSAKKKALEKFKKEKPELGDEQIKYYIDKFSDKQSSNVFVKKDIFQYKFDELEKIIDANFSSEKSNNNKDDVDFKGSEDVIYNNNGLLILLGDLKHKCIRYGKGYTWCISRTDQSNMFFSYRMRLNEPVFYFVFDEDKPKEDKYHAIVIYINKNNEYYVANATNSGDVEMSWSQIENIQPKLKGLQKLFKHIPLSAEERKDYERFKNKIDDSEYDKLSFDEKEKYIGFGHDLSEKQVRKTPKELLSKYAVTSTGAGITADIEKILPSSDRKKLKQNRIERYGEQESKLIWYHDELSKKDLKIRGDLDLRNTKITSLPDNLEVGGSLSLSRTTITSLPDNLKVGGDLYLDNTKITSLPDNLKVRGDLDLRNTKITSLPDNLKVGGGLYLTDTKITSLPDNLEVGGKLYLADTNITSLPDNLKVGGSLYLTDTKITSLPDNLKVRGTLSLSRTPITSLPDNLKVGGDLYLRNTKITSLPDNLKVRGTLDLIDTEITSLPDNLEVGGKLYLSSILRKKYGTDSIKQKDI